MNILVSACLLGAKCRYNGKGELDPNLVQMMKEHILIPVCPEIYGGLPTPRTPAERIGDRVVTSQGEDVTKQYQRGAKETERLACLYGCSFAVLKERSPSCGSGVIYDGSFSQKRISGDGVTAACLKKLGIKVFGESQIPELQELLKGKRE